MVVWRGAGVWAQLWHDLGAFPTGGAALPLLLLPLNNDDDDDTRTRTTTLSFVT